MPKITKRVVDSLTPDPAGEVYCWDSELRGFGVRMMPSGVGSFILKYRNSENRQRKLALGRLGTLTPDEARNLARQRLAEVTHGADPSAERRQVRNAINIADLCDLYLADAMGHLKPKSYEQDVSRVERHVKPLLGRHSALSLTAADVAKMQADIAAGKTAVARAGGRGGATTGGKAVAASAVVMMGIILEFARRQKIVTENVAREVRRPPAVKRSRYLTKAEMGRLGKAMRAAEEEADNATGLAAIRFLLLSGCRKMEVLALPAAWVDQEGGCIRFGDTKTGAQIRPIGTAAFAALPPLPAAGWVFPASRGNGHFIGIRKVLDRVCQRAELEGVTVHVLRHSFASMAAGMGFSELTIAGLLGHSMPGVTARYSHLADTALVAAADKVAAEIAAALG